MPGTNLTRDEAQQRAAILEVSDYDISLDFTTGETTFASTTRVNFTSSEVGASTFIDLVEATVHSITLNGVDVPTSAYADSRIALDSLAAENELVVVADCTYSHAGEGVHRFVDPADDRVYLYTQFETADSRRVFTVFEQPDLKAVFTWHVTAPEGWVVVSNTATPEPKTLGDGKALWDFEPSKRMSSYINAIIAGEYYGVFDVYEGKFGTIPLGHYCRQSLAEFMDADDLFTITKQSFSWFEEQFDFPYPFGKYDQLYVPEYNMGAMENAGAVTVRDEYLPRSRQPRSFYEFRASIITHEMAHMWFGDLVTMKWWDDLWLNESFAEWACYWCEANVTEFTDAWTGFANARKITGYTQDQMPTTHPIAADNYDLQAVEVNFDMITYAKGASVLKQLVAWVGIDPFLKGLRAYFKEFAYKNSEFKDLLGHLEAASGRELSSWAQEWLQTAGVNTFTPVIEVGADGTYSRLAIKQTAHPDWPTLRRHRVGIGFYDADASGVITRTEYLEVDVEGELTEITDATGKKQPALLLLNDNDLAYAKIRLDEKSLNTALTGLASIDDSLTRALVWSAAWDMTRDGEFAGRDYLELVLANIGKETDAWGVTRTPANAALTVRNYTAPEKRQAARDRWESGLRELLADAAPGSDHQLTFMRQLAAVAHSPAIIAELKGVLDGSVSFDGLAIDQDLRWGILTGLAAAGAVGETEIAAELAKDNTITGQERAASARAAQPLVEAKAAAWEAMLDPATPNETQRSIAVAFQQYGQDEVLHPYIEKFLRATDTIWEHLGSHRASNVLLAAFPAQFASEALLATVDAWLATTPAEPAAKRYIQEGRAGVVRSLNAQKRDAQAE